MKHLAPAYYGAFTCLADRCRDNCCIGWEIGIDPDTAAFYDSFPGETGDWLRSGITPPGTDRCFLPDSQGRCRFLNEKNLCTAYLRVGEQAMAEICREHPRFHNWYADVLETGLGLCCEETARLILTTPGPFTLTELPDCPDEAEEPDPFLTVLRTVREMVFRFLEDPALPLAERLRRLTGLGWTLQHHLSDPAGLPALCRETLAKPAALSPLTEADGRELLTAARELERLSDEWEALLTLGESTPSAFLSPSASPEEEAELARIGVYLIYRYFLPLALDGDLCSPLCFPEAALRLIRGLWQCGGAAEPAERQRIAQLFSKEIEYSEENREEFCQAALSWCARQSRPHQEV